MSRAESPADDIARYLATQGVGSMGGSSGWAIFIGTEPAKPETVITVYDTGGAEGNPDGPFYDPLIQVRVRAHDYGDGYNKAAEIRDLLILPTARILGDWLYTGIWLTSDVAKIGRDDNDRNLFTTNYRLMREPYSTE